MKGLNRLAWPILAIVFSTGCDVERSSPTTPTAILSTQAATAGCAAQSVGFTPLTDSGSLAYPGVPLGLYPGGNTVPSAHLAAGVQVAAEVRPLRLDGRPHPEGRIGLISIGMSNTRDEWEAFQALGPSPNGKVVLVQGAQGGQGAGEWAKSACACWNVLETNVTAAGLSAAQVKAAWIKVTNVHPGGVWPSDVTLLRGRLRQILLNLVERFPNVRLAYLSSRVYAGYAVTNQSPEPYAYQNAYAVRDIITRQIEGHLPFTGAGRVAPWIAWGPYLWADGIRARSDGLTWACSDFEADGTHPSASGKQKVAQQLLDFFRNHPTTQEWFMAAQVEWPPIRVD